MCAILAMCSCEFEAKFILNSLYFVPFIYLFILLPHSFPSCIGLYELGFCFVHDTCLGLELTLSFRWLLDLPAVWLLSKMEEMKNCCIGKPLIQEFMLVYYYFGSKSLSIACIVYMNLFDV